MAERCLLYYITDRTAFASDEPTRRRRLLEKVAEAASAGVDYIQLREKDLTTRELESLTREAVHTIRDVQGPDHWPLATALLINSRTEVALAAGADGVHLRSEDVSPLEVRAIWSKSQVVAAGVAHVSLPLRDVGFSADRRRRGAPTLSARPDRLSPLPPVIGVSCHSSKEVARAESEGATFAVFAPVFEKKDAAGVQPAGLSQLREACKAWIPVLALGGITLANARRCIDSGAAGIAAIRLFQQNDISKVVANLRSLRDPRRLP